MRRRIDFSEGSLFKSIVLLAWPVVIANLLQTGYNVIDAFWLGKLGKVAFSAPTIAWPVIFIGMSFAFGFSVAANSLVAQYMGMKDEKNAKLVTGQSLLVSIMMATVLAVIGIIFAVPIMKLMGAKGDVLDLSSKYMMVIYAGGPFAFIMFVVGGALRGWGDSKTAMYFTIFSVVANIILDPLMIFGVGFPKMGVVGAALATIISRAVASIYALYIIFYGKHSFRISFRDLKPNLDMILRVFKVGLPTSLGQSITAFGFSFVMSIVARFGPAVISAYGVGNRIISMISMFAGGVGTAVSTAVGQTVGAGKINRAKSAIRIGAWTNFLLVTGFSFLTFFYGQYVTKFFINDPEVVKMGVIFFSLVSFSLPFFATMQIFVSAINGSGHTVQATIINIIRLWGIRVPSVVILAEIYGFRGVFYGMIISNIAAMFLAYGFVKWGKWQTPVVNTK
jgi:putative MATE family efflux protein